MPLEQVGAAVRAAAVLAGAVHAVAHVLPVCPAALAPAPSRIARSRARRR